MSFLCVIQPSPETLFPAAAAEKFLQEEERRAKDFEQILNSHIEELQRQSSNTIKNYATLKQTYRRWTFKKEKKNP